ncbi:helix-turn-helix domain-containing protein [Nocardioides sp. Bht2]|uniref:helix-turn-helix domain-containing protein n=1 Tax=Nocardioides sp. Bht2 TaxID=3392297 RepID=UPI0039B4D2E3
MTTQLHQQVGRRLLAIRQEKKVSQEALADSIGMHRSYIGALERGERNPSLRVIYNVAERLGVSTDYLLCSHGEQHT